MASLLKVDKFSGPSMQCHISYQWCYTWIALLRDIHKANSTLHTDGEPSLQHFCQLTATLTFPAAWICLFDCSGHQRLAVLSCIPFYLLGKRLIAGQCFRGLASQIKHILPLKSSIYFCFSPFLNSQFSGSYRKLFTLEAITSSSNVLCVPVILTMSKCEQSQNYWFLQYQPHTTHSLGLSCPHNSLEAIS